MKEISKGQWISQDQWDKYIHHFSPIEFSEDPLKYSDFQTIKNLESFRSSISRRIFPSPASGALARFSGSKRSQHYVGSDMGGDIRGEVDTNTSKKSQAVDVFIEGNALINWSFVLACQLFKGVGIYLDTEYHYRPWPMFHLDTREKGYISGALIWVRYREEYYYPQLNDSDRIAVRGIFRSCILLKENIFKR